MEYNISAAVTTYFACWVFLLLGAFTITAFCREKFEFLTASYLKFLLEPWKLLTFLLAMSIITLAAPYSGDHTWDTFDSIIISLLTYYFCPWSLAIFYRFCKKLADFSQLYVAFCLFLTPCWAYDAYILLRDKTYPTTWWSNLIISGGICFAAGLFWNLAWSEKDGAHFAFYNPNWPAVQPTPFLKVLLYSLILMAPVVIAVGWFVWQYCKGL